MKNNWSVSFHKINSKKQKYKLTVCVSLFMNLISYCVIMCFVLMCDKRLFSFDVVSEAGWPAGWLTGWLAGWLAHWLPGWLAGSVSLCFTVSLLLSLRHHHPLRLFLKFWHAPLGYDIQWYHKAFEFPAGCQCFSWRFETHRWDIICIGITK